ncbi:hypothetical protein ENASMM143B3_19055 [Enterobacter asburiae]
MKSKYDWIGKAQRCLRMLSELHRLGFSTSGGCLTSMLSDLDSRSPRDTTFPTMVLRFLPLNFQMNSWQSLARVTISIGQILTVMMPVHWQKNLLLVFLILHSLEKGVIGSMRAGYQS